MARPKGSKNKPKDPTSASADTAAPPEDIAVNTVAKPAEDLPPPGEPHFRSRLSLLTEINDSNRERLQADEESGDDPEAGGEPPASETPPEETGAEPETEPEVTPEPEKPAVAKRRLVIDGVEKEFTEEQIIALAQKNASADSRLAEATRILEDARRTATQTGAGKPAISDDAGQNRQPPGSAGVDDVVQEITDALLFGDRDKVAESISKLLSQGRQPATPTLNPQDIRATVSETIAFERAKTALETPADQGGFADVYGDPMLRAMFERREAELRDGDPAKGIPKDQRPYMELYTSIATELRQWRDDLVKKHSTTGLENRDQHKRLAAVVRGGGGKPPASNAPTPILSHEEKLAQMRKVRGLN